MNYSASERRENCMRAVTNALSVYPHIIFYGHFNVNFQIVFTFHKKSSFCVRMGLFIDELNQERQDNVVMCAMDHFHLFALLHDVTINFLDFNAIL